MNAKICKMCRKVFMPKTIKQEFCNKDCKYNYYNVYYSCDNCGEKFLTKRTMIERLKSGRRKHLYCPNCTNNGAGSTDVINRCIACGKEFRVSKSFSNQRYCSKECSSIGQIKFDDIECPICKKMFRPKSINTIFCSNKCKFESIRNGVVCTCHYCGKEFYRKMSEYSKNKQHYCSVTCHYLDISWSEHDKNILRKNYRNISTKDIVPLLDKKYTPKAIKSEARRLGLCDDAHYWTKEEEKILKENYSYISMNKVLTLLPNRTRSSILGKSRQCNLLGYHYLTNCYSDNENEFLKTNYLEMDNLQLSKHLNRTERGIAQHLWVLGLYRPKEKHNYDTLANYVRAKTIVWKNKIKDENNWTCCLTGKHSNIVLHHCRSFNLLLLEAIDDLDFEIKNDLDDYTQQELDSFVEHFLYLQEYYGEYCCITESIHKLFHGIYGYGNNTMDQWIEFVAKYQDGEYKNIA